jgi:hypothetical protein
MKKRVYKTFTGINNKEDAEFIKDNEFENISNFKTDRGIIAKRSGLYKDQDGIDQIKVIPEEIINYYGTDNFYTSNGELLTFCSIQSKLNSICSFLQLNRDKIRFFGKKDYLYNSYVRPMTGKGTNYRGKYFYINKKQLSNFIPENISSIGSVGSRNKLNFNKYYSAFSKAIYDNENNFEIGTDVQSRPFIDNSATENGSRIYTAKNGNIKVYDKFSNFIGTFTTTTGVWYDFTTIIYNNSGTIEKYLVVYSYTSGGSPTIEIRKIIDTGLDTILNTYTPTAGWIRGKIDTDYKNRIVYYNGTDIRYLTFNGSTLSLETEKHTLANVVDFCTNKRNIKKGTVPAPGFAEIYVLTSTQIYYKKISGSMTAAVSLSDITTDYDEIQSIASFYPDPENERIILLARKNNPAPPDPLAHYYDQYYFIDYDIMNITTGSEEESIINIIEMDSAGKTENQTYNYIKMKLVDFGDLFYTQYLYTESRCKNTVLSYGSGTDRQLWISYETEDGNFTPLCLLTQTVGDTIFLYDIPIGEEKIVKRHIFLDQTTRIAEIDNNEDTELLITTWTSIGDGKYAKKLFFNITPIAIESFNNRLFIAGRGKDRNILYYTGINSEYIEGFIYIDDYKNKTLTALKAIGGVLFVFTDNSIWRLTGWTEETFTVNRIIDNYGTADTNLLTSAKGELYFLNSNGIFQLTGSGIKELSKNIEKFVKGIQWKNISENGLLDFYKNKLIIYGKIRPEALDGYSEYSLLLIDGENIIIYDFTKDYLGIIVSPEDQGKIYFISHDSIEKYNFFDIAEYNGTPDIEDYRYTDNYYVGKTEAPDNIKCFFKTKKFSMGDPTQEKQFEEIYFYLKGTGAEVTITTIINNNGEDQETSEIRVLGTDGEKEQLKIRPAISYGNTIQIKLENNDNKEVEIYGFEIIYKNLRKSEV